MLVRARRPAWMAAVLLSGLFAGCKEEDSLGAVLGMGLAVPADNKAPVITFTSPTRSRFATDVSPLTVTGSMTDNVNVTWAQRFNVQTGESVIYTTYFLNFSDTIPLASGMNEIRYMAEDFSGNIRREVLHVTYTRPTVKILSPATTVPFPSPVPELHVRGQALDDLPLDQVRWTNTPAGTSGTIEVDRSGNWSTTVPLIVGSNTIAFSAVDAAGHPASDSIDVTYSGAARAAAWGRNASAQLGQGGFEPESFSAPAAVSGLGPVSLVSAGSVHSAALAQDGTVWTWGGNSWGQLGLGTTTTGMSPAPVPGITNAVSISAGNGHTLVLLSDGTVRAFGGNGRGQLGDGTLQHQRLPVVVPGLSGIVGVSSGGFHSLAVASDGTVWAWGENTSGQLGDGTTTRRATPVQVPGLAGVRTVAAGFSHSLAVLADGTVRAWGSNSEGQLGTGSFEEYSLVPVPVAGLSLVVGVSAGSEHSVALTADGTVHAWGHNFYAQVGDGTFVTRRSPVPVPGLSAVTAISAGFQHSVARRADGTVWTWGMNNYGQVGDGTTERRRTPFRVENLPVVLGVAAGGSHTLAGW